MSRHILNALVAEADLQVCGETFSIKLVHVSLIRVRRVSNEAIYGFP